MRGTAEPAGFTGRGDRIQFTFRTSQAPRQCAGALGRRSGPVANMKSNTPLRQPKGWFLFLLVAVPCLWALGIWLKDWPLGVIAVFMSLYLVVDIWNLVGRKKADQKQPECSKKKALKS
jgi:hypothetical protein